MSYPGIDRFRLVNYTYDREFVIITTNVSDSGGWETSVFANDPDTDIRDFESLVEQILFSHKGDANHFKCREGRRLCSSHRLSSGTKPMKVQARIPNHGQEAKAP